MKRFIVALAAAAAALLTLPGAFAQTPAPSKVYQFELTGTVDPFLARGLVRAVKKANHDGVPLVIRIDTPGGLGSSMREIIQAILGSKVPVTCWVGPSGARAASAGAFILIGCPTATMAPGTNVGAAHPVGFSGEILSEKVTNDAAAYIRSLAQKWGRNADWAEKAVRESVSVSAKEALDLHVIDSISAVRPYQDVAVKTEKLGLSIGETIFHDLIDPNLAFLFFLFGIAGIVMEVLHPGVSIPGLLGIVLFVSSLVMLGMLPVNIAGVVLLLAAMTFFIVDLKVTAHGVPTVAGIVCLVLGGLFLFNSSVPKAHVSKPLIIGTALVMAGLFVFVVRAAFDARRLPKVHPTERLVGMDGVADKALAPKGIVRVGGEAWSATAAKDVPAGARIRVIAVRGLTLEVEEVTGEQPRPTGVGGTPTHREGA